MQRSEFIRGFRDGIPIALGYFAVAFSLGIIAAWRRMGLFPVAAICCTIVYLMESLIIS